MDIEGNELADREAKLVATRRDLASPRRKLPKTLRKGLPRSTSAVKQAHEAHLQVKWSDEWKKSMHCHTPNMFGTVNMEHTVDSRLSWNER